MNSRLKTALRRSTFAPTAMAFVALLAVGGAVPVKALTLAAAVPAEHELSIDRPLQSLEVSAVASAITIRRGGYTSAAAPTPTPVPKPSAEVQAAAVDVTNVQPWISPTSGRISSVFGPRVAPVAGVSAFHEGTDLVAECGQPVRAAQSGTVIEAGPQGSYGNWTLIDHGNGIQTGYAHSSQNLVGKGQRVAAGATIALVGSTGASTGCHVHFETRVGGTQIDPQQFMSTHGISLG